METIYRAAQKGLEVMNSGSFYTFCPELANNYVCNGDDLYSFNVNLNLFNVTEFMSISDFDLGLSEILEILENEDVNVIELVKNKDGVCIQCGTTDLIILFGRLEVCSNIITKLSFEEMIAEDEINEIVK